MTNIEKTEVNFETFEPVISFLKKNGFKQIKPFCYENDKCKVTIHDYGYEVQDEEGSMYGGGHEIYWLIGYLTYSRLMDKNFIQ